MYDAARLHGPDRQWDIHARMGSCMVVRPVACLEAWLSHWTLGVILSDPSLARMDVRSMHIHCPVVLIMGGKVSSALLLTLFEGLVYPVIFD